MRGFLASHPSLAIPPVGSNMWRYFYRRFGSLSDPANLERCLDAMARYKHVRSLDPDMDRIREEFAAGEPSYARLFAIFLEHFAEREQKPRWGAQSGLVEAYADKLIASYPGARVIHMIRDPRDRYEASLARWPDGRGRAGGAAARWRYSAGLAVRNTDRYPDQYLVVKFEDMVTSPQQTLRQVCAFIGEPYVPTMLAMGGATKHRALLTEGLDIAGDATPLSTEFIGRHVGRISSDELAFIQTATGRLMRRFGYEPDPIGFSSAHRARYMLGQWPNQLARMTAWRAREVAQELFPRVVRRRPAAKMTLASERREAA